MNLVSKILPEAIWGACWTLNHSSLSLHLLPFRFFFLSSCVCVRFRFPLSQNNTSMHSITNGKCVIFVSPESFEKYVSMYFFAICHSPEKGFVVVGEGSHQFFYSFVLFLISSFLLLLVSLIWRVIPCPLKKTQNKQQNKTTRALERKEPDNLSWTRTGEQGSQSTDLTTSP